MSMSKPGKESEKEGQGGRECRKERKEGTKKELAAVRGK